MSARATGLFEVRMSPAPLGDAAADATLGRMLLDKTYTGDLTGTGRGEMLMAGTAVKGSAGYVAIEHVSGTLDGRSGSFVLQHTGTMNRGAPQLSVAVVPDSGTAGLAGLAGTLAIIIRDGKHRYEFDYTLPAPGGRADLMSEPTSFADGGCTCQQVRYRVATRPLFVHCCHCSWCQRETGASFALNAMIESDRVALLQGEVEMIDTPSNSGKGQSVARCPQCRVAVWSHYSGAGKAVSFVRVGTLDEPALMPPDVHIFTTSKQPWVVLDAGTPAVAEYYKAGELWPAESLARRAVLMTRGESR